MGWRRDSRPPPLRPDAGKKPANFGHATVAAGAFPNGQPAQIDMLGKGGDDPTRRRVEVALDPCELRAVLTHGRARDDELELSLSRFEKCP